MTTDENDSRPLLLRGFTLLEILLALALAVVVLSLVGFVVNVLVKSANTGRDQAERDQLARTLLGRIADDLRAAIYIVPDDAPAAALPDEEGETGIEPGGVPEEGNSGDNTSTDPPPEGEETDSASSAETSAPQATPGLYGDQYGVQVDISRLPRPDEIASPVASVAAVGPALCTSEIRTVAYYVGTAPSTPQPALEFFSQSGTGGLIRRELDRAVALWWNEQGDLASLDRHAQLLAPEVIALEFRYFDGVQWLNSWDSTARASLPLAVEIQLILSTAGDAHEAGTQSGPIGSISTATDALDSDQLYRLVVWMRAGGQSVSDAAVVPEQQPVEGDAP